MIGNLYQRHIKLACSFKLHLTSAPTTQVSQYNVIVHPYERHHSEPLTTLAHFQTNKPDKLGENIADALRVDYSWQSRKEAKGIWDVRGKKNQKLWQFTCNDLSIHVLTAVFEHQSDVCLDFYFPPRNSDFFPCGFLLRIIVFVKLLIYFWFPQGFLKDSSRIPQKWL